MLTGELYRRAGQWKFRAIGQGYASGLAGLATDFGISVDDDPAPAPAQQPPAPAPQWAPPAVGNYPGATPLPPPPPPGPAPVFPGNAPFPASTTGQPGADPDTKPPPVNLDKGKVNLVKGARVSLVKRGAPPLVQVMIGLGWDPAEAGKKVDLDASAIAFDATGKKLEIVWFMHLKQFRGALVHTGDNLTGQGEGDDEQIRVDLLGLPQRSRRSSSRSPRSAGTSSPRSATRSAGSSTTDTGQELVRYDLSESQPATGGDHGDAAPHAGRAVGDARDRRVPRREDGEEAGRAGRGRTPGAVTPGRQSTGFRSSRQVIRS